MHDAKKRLSQSEKDLKKLRDSMKPTAGKKHCHDDPAKYRHDRPEGKHVTKTTHSAGNTITKTTRSSGNTITKTASSSGNGASSWSSATSTNGTASADAW